MEWNGMEWNGMEWNGMVTLIMDLFTNIAAVSVRGREIKQDRKGKRKCQETGKHEGKKK